MSLSTVIGIVYKISHKIIKEKQNGSNDLFQTGNAAKARLNQLNVEYLDKSLGVDFTREELLELFPNAKTFPQIVDSDGTYIGGYSELIEKSRYRITIDKE